MPITQLNEQELKLIEAARLDLQSVESITGVDWRLLVGIWYRENSLRRNTPTRTGGSWQFDPPLSDSIQKKLLDKYTSLTDEEKQNIIVSNDFRSDAILAAAFLRNKVKQNLDVRVNGDIPDNIIGDALYAYNGRAFGPDWKNSPYVNNNADPDHMGLLIVATVPDKINPKIRVKINQKDTRLGAFVVYRQLKQIYPRTTIYQNNPQNNLITSPDKVNDPSQEDQSTISFLD